MASDTVLTRVPLSSMEPSKEFICGFATLDVTGTETFQTGLSDVKAAFIQIAEDLIDAQEYGATVTISTQSSEPGQIIAKTWKMTTADGGDTTPAATATNPVTCYVWVVGTP